MCPSAFLTASLSKNEFEKPSVDNPPVYLISAVILTEWNMSGLPFKGRFAIQSSLGYVIRQLMPSWFHGSI